MSDNNNNKAARVASPAMRTTSGAKTRPGTTPSRHGGGAATPTNRRATPSKTNSSNALKALSAAEAEGDAYQQQQRQQQRPATANATLGANASNPSLAIHQQQHRFVAGGGGGIIIDDGSSQRLPAPARTVSPPAASASIFNNSNSNANSAQQSKLMATTAAARGGIVVDDSSVGKPRNFAKPQGEGGANSTTVAAILGSMPVSSSHDNNNGGIGEGVDGREGGVGGDVNITTMNGGFMHQSPSDAFVGGGGGGGEVTSTTNNTAVGSLGYGGGMFLGAQLPNEPTLLSSPAFASPSSALTGGSINQSTVPAAAAQQQQQQHQAQQQGIGFRTSPRRAPPPPTTSATAFDATMGNNVNNTAAAPADDNNNERFATTSQPQPLPQQQGGHNAINNTPNFSLPSNSNLSGNIHNSNNADRRKSPSSILRNMGGNPPPPLPPLGADAAAAENINPPPLQPQQQQGFGNSNDGAALAFAALQQQQLAGGGAMGPLMGFGSNAAAANYNTNTSNAMAMGGGGTAAVNNNNNGGFVAAAGIPMPDMNNAMMPNDPSAHNNIVGGAVPPMVGGYGAEGMMLPTAGGGGGVGFAYPQQQQQQGPSGILAPIMGSMPPAQMQQHNVADANNNNVSPSAANNGGANKNNNGNGDQHHQHNNNNIHLQQPQPQQQQGGQHNTKVQIGMLIRKWVVLSRIGAGSFGETFCAAELPEGFSVEAYHNLVAQVKRKHLQAAAASRGGTLPGLTNTNGTNNSAAGGADDDESNSPHYNNNNNGAAGPSPQNNNNNAANAPLAALPVGGGNSAEEVDFAKQLGLVDGAASNDDDTWTDVVRSNTRRICLEVLPLLPQNMRPLREVCIKVEQDSKNVLRLEVQSIRKCQECPQVVRIINSGHIDAPLSVNYLVMERLGPNLADLRRACPNNTFDVYTSLKVGISCLKVIRSIHDLGLTHRDIKPSNFVVGLGPVRSKICYLIDFGLARRFKRSNGQIRPARENTGFRGTNRYASIQSHKHCELGRVDDLWSLLFMLVEMVTGSLPWRKYKEKEQIGECKMQTVNETLVQEMPREFGQFLAHLQSLTYESEPNYDLLISLLEAAIVRRNYAEDRPLGWERCAAQMLELDATPDGRTTRPIPLPMSIRPVTTLQMQQQIPAGGVPAQKKPEGSPTGQNNNNNEDDQDLENDQNEHHHSNPNFKVLGAAPIVASSSPPAQPMVSAPMLGAVTPKAEAMPMNGGSKGSPNKAAHNNPNPIMMHENLNGAVGAFSNIAAEDPSLCGAVVEDGQNNNAIIRPSGGAAAADAQSNASKQYLLPPLAIPDPAAAGAIAPHSNNNSNNSNTPPPAKPFANPLDRHNSNNTADNEAGEAAAAGGGRGSAPGENAFGAAPFQRDNDSNARYSSPESGRGAGGIRRIVGTINGVEGDGDEEQEAAVFDDFNSPHGDGTSSAVNNNFGSAGAVDLSLGNSAAAGVNMLSSTDANNNANSTTTTPQAEAEVFIPPHQRHIAGEGSAAVATPPQQPSVSPAAVGGRGVNKNTPNATLANSNVPHRDPHALDGAGNNAIPTAKPSATTTNPTNPADLLNRNHHAAATSGGANDTANGNNTQRNGAATNSAAASSAAAASSNVAGGGGQSQRKPGNRRGSRDEAQNKKDDASGCCSGCVVM